MIDVSETFLWFSIGVLWGGILSSILRSIAELIRVRRGMKGALADAKALIARIDELQGHHHIDPPKKP